jgi:hypothetical protein
LQAAIASPVNHAVRLPRLRRAASYSARFVARSAASAYDASTRR